MSRSYYDVQQVCLNGHQITDQYNKYPQHRQDHCSECGAKTIHECPECEQPIRGFYNVSGVVTFRSTDVPSHCKNCGEPYPWTTEDGVASAGDEHELGPTMDFLRQICERFHLVARNLRDRHDDRPTLEVNDEYDIQDLLHALLRLFFDDVRPEEYSPSYAGQSSRIDFLLKEKSIAVEVKTTQDGLEAGEIGGQLLIDIGRYSDHPSVETLVCFVYDPGSRMTNPRGLERDLSGEREGLSVEVLVAPRGY